MTLLREAKPLTVEQYKFYKTQENPLTDKAVMKIHGMDNNHFYAWKKQHKLNGVKFEPKVRTSQLKVTKGASSLSVDSETEKEPSYEVWMEGSKVKSKLLKENDIPAERIKQGLPSIDNPVNKTPVSASDKQDEQIPTGYLERAVEASMPVFEETIGAMSVDPPQNVPLNTDNHVNLIKLENEELKQQLISLEERHVKDADQFYQMEALLKKSEERGDDFRDRMMAAQRQHREAEERLLNALNQIKRQDELLVKANRNQNLLFQTMELAVEQQKAIQSSVESGEF